MANTTDIDGMLEQMTPEQFEEWCEIDSVEPIGQPKMLALIAYQLTCALSDEKPDPHEFMPWLQYQPEPADEYKTARQILSQIGG